MTLPLPLSAFEEYMLADDRPAYPMSFFIRAEFSGRLNRAEFGGALKRVAMRHPLLAAVVDSQRRRPVWAEADGIEIPIHWSDAPGNSDFPHAQPIDLHCMPGLTIHVRTEGERVEMFFQFHHACCDAVAAVRFIDEVLLAYGSRLAPRPDLPGFSALDERGLRCRNKFKLPPGQWLQTMPRQLRALRGVRRFLMHRPVPVTPYDPACEAPGPPGGFPTACYHQFDVAETESVVAAAKTCCVTVNDLMVRDLYLALDAWRQENDVGKDRDWLRISVPINLRLESDDKLPAANVVTMVFLDRRRRDFQDPDSLLGGIHEELSRIKRWRLGYVFLLSLKATRWLPGGLARATRPQRCMSTCVLSNLGRLFEDSPNERRDGRIAAGDLLLERIDLLPPIRPHTCASFALTTYAGQLSFALHYDPSALTNGQARNLLDLYVNFIRQSTDKSLSH
jgi:NRPS condensation-like uncharacterized protein